MQMHFSSMKYSVLKYGTNTKAAQSKYDTLSTMQRFRFDWLCSKFSDEQDLVYACIGCALDNVNMQFDTKENILESYHKFKSRRESLTYTLKSDIIKHKNLNFIPVNKLIFKYLVAEISPEYVLLLCHGTNELNELYGSSNFLWAQNKILNLIKYTPFFNVNKYLHLIETHEIYAATE